ALARHRGGPLAEERLAYLSHLADQGLSTESLQHTARYLLVIAHALRLADRPGELIRFAEIELAATLWARRHEIAPNPKAGRSARRSFLSHAKGWLQFLGRLVPRVAPPSRFAAEIDAFADYMHHERGLSPHTIRGRCWVIQRCLDRLSAADGSLR